MRYVQADTRATSQLISLLLLVSNLLLRRSQPFYILFVEQISVITPKVYMVISKSDFSLK